jgi:hypothetical protein
MEGMRIRGRDASPLMHIPSPSSMGVSSEGTTPLPSRVRWAKRYIHQIEVIRNGNRTLKVRDV